jgi:hypothetical protein
MSGERSRPLRPRWIRRCLRASYGDQDLERLDALLEHFNIFEATGWCWGWPRG